jgi:hypothetical protein
LVEWEIWPAAWTSGCTGHRRRGRRVGNAAGADANGESTWTVVLACLVLGGALLSACVTLYLRKQRRRKSRHDGTGRVGKERYSNNNQM